MRTERILASPRTRRRVGRPHFVEHARARFAPSLGWGRLAPEYKFPAPVEDVVAVYTELLKTYRAQHIAIYGSSAGAVLTPEVAVKLKQRGLPLPGALGVFSGGGDFTRDGDSQQVYGVHGLSGDPDNRPKGVQWLAVYVGSADPKNPVLSPVFADLHGMPPTLFMTSTRDMLLSHTTILHRAFLRAGVDASLVVFEGLNHCFWYDPMLPESREADQIMADFLISIWEAISSENFLKQRQ